MKLLKSILILILIMCACVCNAQDVIPLDGDYETYDVGVEKTIEVPYTFKIVYMTKTLPLNNKDVMLCGTIEVNRKYKVVQLEIDYYIFDGNHKSVRATNLNLQAVSPGVFSFEYQYPLDLNQYEYEIFSLVFIVEEVPTQTI